MCHITIDTYEQCLKSAGKVFQIHVSFLLKFYTLWWKDFSLRARHARFVAVVMFPIVWKAGSFSFEYRSPLKNTKSPDRLPKLATHCVHVVLRVCCVPHSASCNRGSRLLGSRALGLWIVLCDWIYLTQRIALLSESIERYNYFLHSIEIFEQTHRLGKTLQESAVACGWPKKLCERRNTVSNTA